MAITAARLEVAGPVRSPLPYGLLSVAQVQTSSDAHWQLGVEWEPITCSRASITLESCPATGGADKTPSDVLGLSGANPFTVYTMAQCSTVGFEPRAQTLATSVLTNGEARAVEREFWTGENGINPHLAEDTAVTGTDGEIDQSAASVLVSGSGVDVIEAIGRMEEALGDCYGSEGVIHVPPAVLTHMAAEGLITKDGARLRSPGGHLVAVGAGYPGTAPDGTTPPTGTRWIYGTGAVFVYRSDITLVGADASRLNRARNTVAVIAERTYVLGWDCCHFGALVKIGGIAADTFGS